MILTLEYYHSPARYLLGRGTTGTSLGARASGVVASNLSPLRLMSRSEPRLPGEGWTRVRPLLSGICGSDLGLLTGRNSPYFSALVSMPFTPGHEVVGETLDELPGLPSGSRVVLDPVLGCVPRAVEPCEHCAAASAGETGPEARDAGDHDRCNHISAGAVATGLQTGYCTDTGGGWSRMLVAHASQLHAVPSTLDTRRAVLVEPLACAIHSVRRVAIPDGAGVLVVGAGTVGLLTVLALRECTKAGPIYVIAKHAHQRERARELGATEIFSTERAARALRRAAGGFLARPERGEEFLLGGAELAFDRQVRALRERLRVLSQLAPHDATMPFGMALVLAALLVLVRRLGGKRENGEAGVVGGVGGGVLPEKSDERDAVLIHGESP